MNVNVGISSVDGESYYSLSTPSVERAEAFLDTHDHEGSSISMSINVDDSEEVYIVLKLLREVENIATTRRLNAQKS